MTINIKPFVKWAGGKSRMLNYILPMLPEHINTYHEPFVGGGVLFLHLLEHNRIENPYISDINPHLINCYEQIRNSPCALITALKEYQRRYDGSRQFYNNIRAEFNMFMKSHYETGMIGDFWIDIQQAARFIFLNKTGFNGLYRVNKAGLFNTPKGGYSYFKCDEENLLKINLSLSGHWTMKFLCCDYVKMPIDVMLGKFDYKEGDFIFCDPPYHNTFDSYSAEKFGECEQNILRDNLLILSERYGVKFMVTNSDTDFIRELYYNFNQKKIESHYIINPKTNVASSGQLIITNY